MLAGSSVQRASWDARAGAELARRDQAAVAARQVELLRGHLAYCAANSPFYRELIAAAGFEPGGLRELADLARLPLTCKADLEARHADFLALPHAQLVDLCLTSGTTGKPVAMLQSAADLERLRYNEEISFRGAGFTSADRVLIGTALDRCFMAGLAYFMGLSEIGATVIRGGSGGTALLRELIRNCRPNAVVAVPTLMMAVADLFEADGIDPKSLGIEKMVLIGEPIRQPDFSLTPLGQRLKEAWGSALYGTYASTEMATSFTDCGAGLGGHLHPDLMVVEILDEEGRPVPDGTPGEVVATPLGVTGMPLVRFRTGDIAALFREPCPCGRTTPRLGPVLGRKSQMLKVRGTTVYPPAISTVLQGIPGVRGYYIEVESDFALSDRVRVVVGAGDPRLEAHWLAEQIGAAIRVRPEVVLASPEEVLKVTIREDKRKPVTFFDKRVRSN